MDDGMNDDVAASRTTPSDQKQQKPSTTDRRGSEGHFPGFHSMCRSLLVKRPASSAPNSCRKLTS